MKPSIVRTGCLTPAGLLVLALLPLSGCTDLVVKEGYPLSLTVRDCLKGRPHFVDVWGCIQTRYASGKMGEADKRISAFLKLGDDLAGHVSAGEMVDSEAKTKLAAGAAKLDAD